LTPPYFDIILVTQSYEPLYINAYPLEPFNYRHLFAVSNGYNNIDKNDDAIKDIPIFCMKFPIYPSFCEFLLTKSNAGKVNIALNPDPKALISHPLYNPNLKPSSI
jgi:hypothetical protein